MKHPFMVTWCDENGRRRASSFRTAEKRDTMAQALLGRGLTVYVADQLQIHLSDEWSKPSTYDPRYEIPY